MIKDIFRRVTAGALSALTLFTAVPLSGATDSGIMPLAEEDNKASAVTIKVGEVYNIADRGVQKAWFQQNGAPRNVWPMYTTASDGTEIRAYCADHSKSNPGTGGMPYTVTGRVDDMHVYGVAAMSDSRMTLNEIISTVGAPLTAENFTADMYFSASQAALWAALGDAQIAANNNFGVNYVSSTSLGYRASGKTLSASTTSEALTLYTAIEMLKYGNDFYAVWGPSGKGHAPWVGATINYTPGNTEYAPAAQKAGTIDVGGSIVSGGTFAEKQIDGQDYMVLPMAAASATFVRGEGEYGQIFVRADNVPDGAFLMDSQGNKSYADGGSQRITLSHVASNKELYKNGNDMAYGETFLFCIPKATAEQMDTASTPLETQFFVSMAVDRYNVYVASTNSSGVQPVIMVEPGVQALSANVGFAPQGVLPQNVDLKILKTDENGAGLAGCTFQITYGSEQKEATTDGNGEIRFRDLPINTDVTIKETAAPEGYQLLPSKVINTGSTGGKTVEYTFANSDDHVFKVHKTSSADGRNLMGAKFEVKGIDNDFINTYTTDALGEFTIQGRDLPNGSFEVYEIAAPEGYVTDGSDIQTFSWDNTRDVTLSFKNAPLPGIQIYKYDKDNKEPLAGATFEIRRDGQVLQTVKTDVNGYAKVYNLPKGFYQVVEVEPPQGYLKDEVEHEVYIDPSADPTQIVREVNVPNTKKLSIRIIKQDKDTKVPLQGWKFDVYYNDAKLTSVTTNQDGEAMIENLQPGTYRVVEVDGDTEHYNLDAPEQTVELIKDQAEIPTTDRDLVLTLDNVEQKSFIVKKIDSETKEPLAGVQFKIWRDSVLLGDYTTDENGRIEIKNAPAGTYKVQEVATLKEYILNNEVLEIEHTTAKDTELTVENTKRPGLLIQKIDAETRKPLKDAVFQLKKANGDMVKEDIITGEDGTAFIEGLDAGDYIVTEVTAPGGYVVDDTPHSVSLEEGKTYTLTLENTKKPGLLIKKIDSQTKKPLQGAVFKITRGNGSVVRESVTTDADGVIHLPELDTGTYIITEITAPDGYAIDETPKTVEIRAGQTYEVTFTNTKKGGFTIKKIDEDTRQPLKNAVFKITKSNGEFVKEAETDANGVITLDGLTEGSYIVTEIKAPDGYILQDTPKTFEIKDGGSMELVFTNKKAYGLQIRKIVKDTGEALPGAKFRVEKATGELIGEYTSNSSGLVTISGLDDGVYVVTEIKAPDGYRLDSTPQNVIVKAGELATVTFENAQLSSVRIRKIDAVTREPIGGVRFLIKDEHNNVIGEYTTDSDGYIELEDDLEEGKYYAEEIQAAPGYIRDEEVKTFRVRRGETTEIVWENTPQQGQIQITKKSKDDNPINGLPAGTLLQGATFEIYDKAGNVVDTIVSNERGVAISELLPLGRYTIRETKSPQYYGASGETFEAEIEFSGQIVRLEVLNESVYTNVSIVKSGPKQVVPGQPIRWTVSHIANNSTVPLQSFYWRDTLPYQAVTLDKIVTGTYNARLSYKIVYRTNLNRDYRTLADNLSTAQNRTIQANPTALGLKSGEVVTDFMFVFGNVPAGFRCVETPYVYGNVRSSVAGTAFVNKADVGGLHNQQWIMSNDAWTTDIYRVTKPTLPQTGW